MEVGGRWDSGAAEQGLGAELGGGVAYTQTEWGLSVDAQGRYLLVHEDGGFEDWGASVNVWVDPGVAGQGLYLTVVLVWGQASSGVEQLWAPTAVLAQAGGSARPAAGWRPGRVDVDRLRPGPGGRAGSDPVWRPGSGWSRLFPLPPGEPLGVECVPGRERQGGTSGAARAGHRTQRLGSAGVAVVGRPSRE